MPKIRISSKYIISALSELNTKKAYGPDGIPPVVLKTCASELAPCLGKLFYLCLSTSTFPSCWKRALIQLVPKKGDPSHPFGNIPILLILSQIASMAYVRSALLVIFFLFPLTLGPPLFGISVNHLLWRWTYQKPSIESGTKL
ncbi:UNVERIFIED_CONTAM: hypothetical protein RMT77_018583 [Armadillidium vulgare]